MGVELGETPLYVNPPKLNNGLTSVRPVQNREQRADFLSSELESLEKFQAEEFGYAIKSREFAIMQKIASGSILCDNEYIEELKRTYEDCLRHEIKNTMIKKMRKSGIDVPEGI